MGIEASNASAASDMFYGQSFEECQQKCTREPTCNVFTHNKRSGRCYLYSSAASLRPNADFDSGVRK
jgi:hypothetical protein